MYNISIWKGSWQPAESVPEHTRRKPARCDFWNQTNPCAPRRQLIHPKLSKGTLVDNRPTKRVKVCKRKIF